LTSIFFFCGFSGCVVFLFPKPLFTAASSK
jgi:hypothetical protein